MDIVIDFDGTVVTHDFPETGKDIGAVPVLKELIDNGHNLILFTMRCDNFKKPGGTIEPPHLTNAIMWFKQNDIKLFGIQNNPSQKTWTTSPKAYGKLIIDDAALGAPLKFDLSFHHRPFIDWHAVRQMLIKGGLIK